MIFHKVRLQKFLCALVVVLITGPLARADIITHYDFTGNVVNPIPATEPPAQVAPGVGATNLTRTNVNPQGRANAFSANGWHDAGPNFFGFTLTPDATSLVTVTSISMGLHSTGSRMIQRAVQIAAYTPGGTLIRTLGSFSFALNTPTVWNLDLSANPFVFDEPVQFRITATNVQNSGSNFSLTSAGGRPGVLVEGAIQSVPEPSSLLLLGGLGAVFAVRRVLRRRASE